MKICISVGGVVMIWTHKIAWDPKKAQESYIRRTAGVARFAHNRAFSAGPKQHEAGGGRSHP